jgi:hypothetical protein
MRTLAPTRRGPPTRRRRDHHPTRSTLCATTTVQSARVMPSLAAARIARCAGVSRQKALGFCTAGGATQRLARPIGIVPPFLVAAGLAVDLRHGFRGDEEAVAGRADRAFDAARERLAHAVVTSGYEIRVTATGTSLHVSVLPFPSCPAACKMQPGSSPAKCRCHKRAECY